MSRAILDESHIHPAIRERVAGHQQAIVTEVQSAVAQHAVVVVGMGLNPFPRKARKLLDEAGVAYHYLEYGNYLNKWRERNALKLWTGWPTFPMVFVKGTLVGGANDVQKLIEYAFGDRVCTVAFMAGNNGVTVRVTFDAETENPVEQQREGWQAILHNFAKHVEAHP